MEVEVLYSENIESTVLGAMMIKEECCLVVREENVKADDFYKTYNQVIFRTILNVFKEKGTVDLVMVLEKLKENEEIDKANGITYVTELSFSVPTTANLTSYIELLKEYSRKRKLVDVAKYINTNIGKSVEEVQQGATSLLTDLIEDKTLKETSENQADEYLNVLEKRMNGEIVAIKTGLTSIDREISGFSGGDLVTIFAFSGVGKTALATCITLNIIRQKKRVLFFSLEMPKEQIRDRIISSITEIPFRRLKNGKLEGKEIDNVVESNSFLSKNKSLVISEEDDLMNIISKIQIEIMRNHIDVIFIDYINLINIMGYNKDEYLRIAECTRLLKKLAKRVDKPIVILAQGKQEQASKMSNRNIPVWDKVAVNDIAGGAAIYRDSDIVLGIYRNVELDNKLVRESLRRENENNIDYNSTNPDKNPGCMDILIKKSRASGKAIVPVRWNANIYRINNWM